jgi:threonine/homoserine/homoserine lactone efflux protein
MAVGAAFGLRQSWAYVLGIVLGTVAVLVAVATGIVSMLVSLPGLAPLILAAALVYILYLAFRIATAPPLTAPDGNARAPSFAAGFLLGAGNPKAYAAIAAVFAGSTLPLAAPVVAAVVKAAARALLLAGIHGAGWMAGTSLARFLRDPKISRITNVVFAVILTATALAALLG